MSRTRQRVQFFCRTTGILSDFATSGSGDSALIQGSEELEPPRPRFLGVLGGFVVHQFAVNSRLLLFESEGFR